MTVRQIKQDAGSLKQATTQGVTEIIVTSHHLHPRYTTPIEKVKSCLNHIES